MAFLDKESLDGMCKRIKDLENAIRKHRDAKGHDRCWQNDKELYRALGEDIPDSLELPPLNEFLQGCCKYAWGQYKDVQGAWQPSSPDCLYDVMIVNEINRLMDEGRVHFCKTRVKPWCTLVCSSHRGVSDGPVCLE